MSLVVGIGEITPTVLLLELLEPVQEARPLAARCSDLRRLEPSTELGSSGINHWARQDCLRDRCKDLAFDELGW